jgi:hypothetical protein
VLFATMTDPGALTPVPLGELPDAPWCPPLSPPTALVLDLPGVESIRTAIAITAGGYRPVPMFNTCPGPGAIVQLDRIVASRSPGAFDNRWIVFPQDFPSGTFLRSQGIARALIVRADAADPFEDLARVLSGWRRAGVELQVLNTRGADAPRALHPGILRSWRPWVALAMVGLGLRRSSAGGFGARIPQQSSGGGGWA